MLRVFLHRHHRQLLLSLAVACSPCLPALASGDLPPPASGDPDFRVAIRPLLERSCLKCHGADKQKSGLRLDQKADAFQGGDSGPAIIPGKSAESLLIQLVSGQDDDRPMPPKGNRLTSEEIGVLRTWIDHGANWPEEEKARVNKADWWSWKPLSAPAVPRDFPHAAEWTRRNEVDAFVQERLARESLRPSPEADRATLITRLSFDLLGLPPSPEEIDAFVNDPDPAAYELLVERLLASPQYGERWARHWLDVAHFAETHGHDQDRVREHAWPYRDYLIASFNANKPYPRFLREQIAGDALFPGDPQAAIALGFLAAGPFDESSMVGIREDSIDHLIGQYLDRDDILMNVMNTFASVTVQCARCHDHKFDAVTQADYYSLQAVFAGVDKADRAVDRDPVIARQRRDLARQIASLSSAANNAAATRADLEKELAALPKPEFVFAGASEFVAEGGHKPTHGQPRVIHLLRRGDVRQPGPEALPGALSALGLPARFETPPDDEAARRAALADWLADWQNPLVWRSIVNRIWHYHFGRGLCETPNDLGHMGGAPSHPELLDWLAVWFRDRGGSLKDLHRLMVTSATYRQSSSPNPEGLARDFPNRLLWRMPRQMLDAECVHDAVLSAAGRLDLRMGGPSDRQFDMQPGIHVTPKLDYAKFDPDSEAGRRRSVYRFLFRTLPDPVMDALGCPAGDQAAPVRDASVTLQQTLALWNSAFLARESERFAERLSRSSPDLPGQIRLGVRLAWRRSPTPHEEQELSAYATRHGLSNLCRVLFNTNDFLFVN